MKMLPALLLALALPLSAAAQGLVINHRCTDTSRIPAAWVNQVKSGIRLHYAHTSHGSQLMTGAAMLESQNAAFDIAVGYSSLPSDAGALRIFDGQEGETYITPDLYWESAAGLQDTRDVLNHNPSINVSMWAWCGQVSGYSTAQIDDYLNQMSGLEAQYPGVRFVYFTGHLDGSGAAGTLHQNNERIRSFCRTHNKVLFDFADIESYDPSGNEFMTRFADDNCDYNGGNWAAQWCAANPGSPLCADCSCAHSQPLNCNLKGRAMWWLLARIAGWPGTGDAPPPPAPGNWYLDGSSEGAISFRYGYAGSYPVTGDFDADGVLDYGVYYPPAGMWNVYRSQRGEGQTQFGFAGTLPLAADFDGDGRCDIGVYHPPTGMWYLLRTTRGPRQFQFGFAGTLPVAGDLDRDGRYDFGVYHPPMGMWYFTRSTRGPLQFQYGYPGTYPVLFDQDGNGRLDFGVYDPAGGHWNVFQVGVGSWYGQYGFPGTLPVAGHFDGDAQADIGVYYPGP